MVQRHDPGFPAAVVLRDQLERSVAAEESCTGNGFRDDEWRARIEPPERFYIPFFPNSEYNDGRGAYRGKKTEATPRFRVLHLERSPLRPTGTDGRRH
jgi:hypothetical protein